MPFIFAWMLHGNDEGPEGASRRIAVNWVMPAGSAQLGDVPAIGGEAAFSAVGDLMWPWRFTIEAWWGTGTGIDLQLFDTGDRTGVADRQDAWALLEAELFNRCAQCDAVFSPDAEHFHEAVKAPPRTRLPVARCGIASLPHVFTPLTHLPAVLSQDVLGMVRAFTPAEPVGALAWAPQFVVDMHGTPVRFTPEQAVAGGDPTAPHIVVTYKAQCLDGRPYDAVAFSVLANVATQDAVPTVVVSQLQASDASEVGTRALLASTALSPLVLLGMVLQGGAAGPDAQASAGTILNRAIGPGFLRLEHGKPVMIWERLWDADTSTGDDLFDQWVDGDAVYVALNKHYSDGAKAGGKLLACLRPLFAPQADETFGAALVGIMDHAANARVLVIAWLAATAVRHAGTVATAWTVAKAQAVAAGMPVPPSPLFWLAARSFPQWYDLLATVVDDHEVADMLAGWWRYWLEEKSGAADPRVAQLHEVVDDWIRGKGARAQADQLRDCHAHCLALLAGQDAAPVDIAVAALAERFIALYERLRLPEDAIPTSLGEDRDLAVVIDVAAADVKRLDESLRGYAIALAAGYEQAEPGLDWQWLTDVGGQITNRAGKWEDIGGTDGRPVRLHEAVGAISERGRTVVAFPYAGKPLFGPLGAANTDGDGIDGLRFGWRMDWQTPPLAYGLCYWALATPMGNAGKILDTAYADGADGRGLQPLVGPMFDRAGSFRYLCRVVPGAMIIKPAVNHATAAYEMEGEARAWHAQAGIDPHRRVRVAVIRHDSDTLVQWSSKAPVAVELELVAPDGTPKVVERWINADIAQRALGPAAIAAHGDQAAFDRPNLAADRARLLSSMVDKSGNANRRPRHPAVRAIGVEVAFADGGVVFTGILTPDCRIEDGYMQPGKVVCTSATASSVKVASGTLMLALAAGARALVTVWTLAPDAFFAAPGGGAAPLARLANFGSRSTVFMEAGSMAYRAFAPQQHWFECAPSAAQARGQTLAALQAVQDGLQVVMDGNDAVARIQVAGGVDATWLKGFLVQRHDWHWTGYPLALPRLLTGVPGLRDWTEAFAGTESLVESRVETLQTTTAPNWCFGVDEEVLLCRTRLPALHGARFVACVLRPVRRFDQWLQHDAAVEGVVAAIGKLVPARVDWTNPALRLAPPTVYAAVPLVRTFEAGEAGAVAGINGALLVLDDVLCRTDASARFGGAGEIVDVDLEETRLNNVYEIGPNPIMHAGPVSSARLPAPGTTAGVPLPVLDRMDLPYSVHYRRDGQPLDEPRKMDWQIEVDRPIGLTHDLDRNPKVTQTAMIVRPVGADVGSYWIMAKVRLRRLLEPDDAWTAYGNLPVAAGGWLLARRPEGDDRIPFDFAIGAAPGAAPALAIDDAPGLVLGSRTAPGRRLLCTWHKGHWDNTSETSWGLQVLDQVLWDGARQWVTVARYSPYETLAVTAGLSFKDPAPVRLGQTAGASAQRLLVSDYGEAHWLTFIGMPVRHPSMANASWWMASKNNVITLQRSSAAYGLEKISRDLLINPVNRADLGGTPGSARVGAESNTFHLLLVFARVDDVAAPKEGNPLGQLAGVYRPKRAPITADEPYPPLRFEAYMTGSSMPPGSVGYLYKFQGSSSGMPDEHNPDNWETLMARMFPSPSDGEATVRWLPEFLGPIRSDAPVPDAPLPDTGHIRIDLGALGNVDLRVGRQHEWALHGHSGHGNPWQTDVKGGVCSISRMDGADGSTMALDVEGGGGRLLARLQGWNGTGGGAAIAYDDKGAPSAGAWQSI